MSEASHQQRAEAFVLSMVDLFGCGFIAAVFLFILNAAQPAIDAEQTSEALDAVFSDDARTGDGISGPVRLIIEQGTLMGVARPHGPLARHWPAMLPATGAPLSAMIPRPDSLAWPARLPLELRTSSGAEVPLRVALYGNREGVEIVAYATGLPAASLSSNGALMLEAGERLDIRPAFEASARFDIDVRSDVNDPRIAHMVYRIVAARPPLLGAPLTIDWVGGARRITVVGPAGAWASSVCRDGRVMVVMEPLGLRCAGLGTPERALILTPFQMMLRR